MAGYRQVYSSPRRCQRRSVLTGLGLCLPAGTVQLVRGVAGLYRAGPPRNAFCAGPTISLGGRSLVTLQYLVLVLRGAPGLSRGQ